MADTASAESTFHQVTTEGQYGLDHPSWCEQRRLCDVVPDWYNRGETASGSHRGSDRLIIASDSDSTVTVQLEAYHSDRGAIQPTVIEVQVVETETVNTVARAQLTPEEARRLATLLTEAAEWVERERNRR